jgi:lysophospholipase L1-like esterase
MSYDPPQAGTCIALQLTLNFPAIAAAAAAAALQNRGVPMGNSRSSLIISNWTLGNERSPFYKQPQRLKLVTICFGANDASTKLKDSNWRVIPEAEYKANLVTSVKLFQSQGVRNILLLTPPPAASPPRIDRRLEVTGAYAELVKEVGRQMQVPVVDVFSAIQEDPEWRTAAMLPDGLHLNTVGNRVLHEQVLAAIMASYPAL